MVVSGCRDNTIRIWDAATGQSIAGPFQGHKDFVTSVAYSPDGNYIASASIDQSIKVWKVQQLLSFDNLHEDDGFISSDDFCYCWIAPWFRHAFYLPPLSLVISRYKTYQVPIDNSSSGEYWITCWKSKS
ncbi:WD40-repeat-containing domain protein [Chiua virens]|nr:WD40-repeat-containing domain protein [Chiua virens]